VKVRGARLAQVPGEVAGEHADQHVGLDAFLQAVEDRPQVQVVGFDVPEVPFHVFEVLVGGDHGGRVEFVRGDGGAQHVEPVQGGFGAIRSWRRSTVRVVPVMVTAKCLPVLYLLITLPTSTPIGPAPASRPEQTRAMTGLLLVVPEEAGSRTEPGVTSDSRGGAQCKSSFLSVR
jgi:hypothetical protein